MSVIYKYDISLEYKTVLKLPTDSVILDLQLQNGKPVLWVMHSDKPLTFMSMDVFYVGTGWTLEPEDKVDVNRFIKTLQMPSGLVWHFFYNLV